MADNDDTLFEDLLEDEQEGSEDVSEKKSDEDTSEETKGWEKRYKDLQSEYTKDREELLRLKKAFVGEDVTPTDVDYFDDKELEDALKKNPASVLPILKQMRDETLQVLEAQRREIDKSIAQSDPDQAHLYERVEKLREDEDYASFTDEQLLTLARKSETEGSAPSIKKAYNPGGSRKGRAPKKEANPENSALWKAIYGTKLDEVV